MKKFENKVVIVTGSTSGIGRETAKHLASLGAKVVVTGRSKERGDVIVNAIKENGGDAFFVAADMMVEEDIDAIVAKTIEHYGKIDVLVNNAGIAYLAPMADYDQGRWDNVMKTNVRGPWLLSRKCMPYLLETKGNIVNIGSIAAIKTLPGAYAYCPSKAALVSMTRLLAVEFGRQGVRVNAICPGTFYTEILKDSSQATLDNAAAGTALGYLGQPIEIAKAVAFMASDDASYITGQALYVDGGRTA